MSSAAAPSRSLPQVRTPRSIASVELAPVGGRAELAGVDHDLRRGVGPVGDGVRLGPADDGDVAGASRTGGSPSSGTTQASPRTTATTVSGASSCTRIDQGGVEDDAQQEGAAGARAVEQRRQVIHA